MEGVHLIYVMSSLPMVIIHKEGLDEVNSEPQLLKIAVRIKSMPAVTGLKNLTQLGSQSTAKHE